MKLYRVYTKDPPKWGEVYELHIIAADEKHAERLARMVYWKGLKIPVEVEEVKMERDRIVGFSQWYG